MPDRELYGKYHRLIDELARSAGPKTDWRAKLRAQIDRFEADTAPLSTPRAPACSAPPAPQELCAQFEHEALHSTKPIARKVLFAAVKRLEAYG